LLRKSLDCYRESYPLALSRVQYCYAFHFVAADRDKDFWERWARGKEANPMGVNRVAALASSMLVIQGYNAESANMITNLWMVGYYR
jgi:hypothetical protein